MAKGKQTPRQKMINLMYLVFIAMLAMQIDQEIIRSFQDTNQSLTDSRKSSEEKNDIFEITLKSKADNSPETFGLANQQYKGMKLKADDLVDFIENIKGQLKTEAGFDANKNVEDNFSSLNNTDAVTKKFFNGGDAESPSKNSEELKSKMAALQSYIIQNFGNNKDLVSVVERAKERLSTDDNLYKKQGKNWIQYKFYNQPLIAALSNLEVIQSEARNLQSDALSLMLREKVDADIKFDAFEAVVAAPDVIIQGEPAEAKVFIGTYDSNLPGFGVAGADRTENGIGYKSLVSSTPGEYTFNGVVSFNDANGKKLEYKFSHPYRVVPGAKEVAFESGALLSADKMNVLYRGVQNPISGSILGADNSQTTLTATGGTVTKKGGGSWVVTPGSGNSTILTISGKGPKGQVISQKFEFRIKNVPRPQGQIRGENELTMPATSIANQTVGAGIPDFDFPVAFEVTGFKFKVPGRAAMFINGNSLSSVASLTKNLRTGDICYIADIQATASGLGGQTLKKISPVVINVQ